MGVDVLSVNLDDPTKQYVSGQTLSGKVLLTVSEVETTTAHTYWTEQESHTETRTVDGRSESHTVYETVHYEGNELLFELPLRLFGDGKNRIQIPIGDNVFPFMFQVPTRPLPVTCSFENGYVQYGLEARVKKPWYQVDRKTEVLPVTLFTMVDLNITPGAANSMRVEDSRTFGCCCCCPSEPCFIRSFTPKFGFIPGEVIPCVIEVNNQSDHSIMNLTATFTQMWTLFAYGRRGRHARTHPIALQGAGHAGMGPKEGTTWEVAFTVPPTIPPTPAADACDIVKMEYVILVSAAVDGCCGLNDFVVTHPVVIGTIPIVPIAIVTEKSQGERKMKHKKSKAKT